LTHIEIQDGINTMCTHMNTTTGRN